MTNQNAAAIAEQIGDYRPQVGDNVKIQIEEGCFAHFTVYEVDRDFVRDNAGFGSALQFTDLIRTASGITINEVQND